jgi:toxin ParE1/3/4
LSGYGLRPKAVDNLQAIGDFIATDNPRRAISFIDELLDVCTRIAAHPQAFRRRDDLADGLRQAVHGRYLILFTVGTEGVVIERVVHGARRLEDLL